MAAKESIKNTDEGAASRNFYGLAEHPNNGILSSILKRKGRKLGMTDDCKAMCKQTEAYKGSADRLHQALMYVLVENPVTSRALVQVVRTEPTWRYAATYLKSFDFLQKQGRKGNYENLEPAIKSLENMDAEHEKRVRRQLDILKPLTKFIGDDYWEYARLRKIYWDAIEAYDDAVTLQNKERTEQSEQATANAQAWRNECRVKMMEFIKKAINDQKGKHAEFREEAIAHHRSLGELMTLEVRETTSVVKQPQPITVWKHGARPESLEKPESLKAPRGLEPGRKALRSLEAWKPGSPERPGSLEARKPREAWKPESPEKPGSLEASKPRSLEASKPGSLKA